MQTSLRIKYSLRFERACYNFVFSSLTDYSDCDQSEFMLVLTVISN